MLRGRAGRSLCVCVGGILLHVFGIAVTLLLVAVWAQFCFGSLSAALAYRRGELVSNEPYIVDIGRGSPGTFHTGTVRFINHSTGPLRIVGATADCPCTITGMLPIYLEPGSECGLNVKVQFPRTPGVFTRTAVIVIDNGNLQTHTFRVTGQTISTDQEN